MHGKPWQVCGASLVEPLILDKTPKTVQTILSPDGPNAASFRVVSVALPQGRQAEAPAVEVDEAC